MTFRQRLTYLLRRMLGITVQVDDRSPGWTAVANLDRPNEQTFYERVTLYQDALEAYRHNPLAKTILDITTDFTIGDGITLTTTNRRLRKFTAAFWNHPDNSLDQRLATFSEELARSGDLFVVLFRNPGDGMSYIRLVTKEQISHIETAENDWEKELVYHQITADPTLTRKWYSPDHPSASQQPAIMLHYSINRPAGAAFGEGDLDTILPWLQRYSRMLEDRARAHWAVRSFLWFVTVPTHRVEEKRRQYSRPPEPGSIVVKDGSEEWEVKTPNMHASDARWDLQSIRHMIDAAGYPPHWRGEGGDANLATATAMQLKPERHLKRRQRYLVHILQDIIYTAYQRAWEAGHLAGTLPDRDYRALFTVQTADISRTDNADLAQAAADLTRSFGDLLKVIPANAELQQKLLSLYFKFVGEPLDDQDIITLRQGAPAVPVVPLNPSETTPSTQDETNPLPNQSTRPAHSPNGGPRYD